MTLAHVTIDHKAPVTNPVTITPTPPAPVSPKQVAEPKNYSTQPLQSIQYNSYSSWAIDIVNSMVSPPSPISISVTKNENNQIHLETTDGYKIEFAGKDEAWTIIAPNGTSTRIWGDPHVSESDGTKWDFHKQSSFVFGNNKITVETSPAAWNPDFTYSHKVTLHNGEDRITITDVEKNKPKIEQWKFDAKAHDLAQDDGDVYLLKTVDSKNFQWVKQK